MPQYEIWWQDVDEVMCGTVTAKNHAEARRFALSHVKIRKKKETR